MKIINQQIEVLAHFKDSYPIPLRFKFYNENSGNVVVKVDQVLSLEEGKMLINKVIIYKCQSIINNMEKVYELKHELITGKWFLFKM